MRIPLPPFRLKALCAIVIGMGLPGIIGLGLPSIGWSGMGLLGVGPAARPASSPQTSSPQTSSPQTSSQQTSGNLSGQTSSNPSGNVADANQQKARAVLNKMIETLGGPAYLNVQDLQGEVRYGSFYHGTSNGSNIYYRYWQWPDKDRREFTKARDIVILHTGDKGFETTFRGTKAEDPEQLRRYLLGRDHSLPIVLRQWLNDPGTALFYEGSTIAENQPCERISIINGQNDAVTLLVSTLTHLPIEKLFTTRDPQSREKDEQAEIFDNWKMVQGVNTAYTTVVMRNGEIVSQQNINSISYNNHPQSSLFEPGALNYDRTKK